MMTPWIFVLTLLKKVPLNPSFNLNQLTSALNHLDIAHLIISLETNLPRKPPRSNVPLFQELFPSLETSIESEIVPSLKNVLMVDNSYGRIDPSRFKAFKVFRNTLEDGTGRGALSEEGLDPNDIVNIQFTSGCVFQAIRYLTAFTYVVRTQVQLRCRKRRV